MIDNQGDSHSVLLSVPSSFKELSQFRVQFFYAINDMLEYIIFVFFVVLYYWFYKYKAKKCEIIREGQTKGVIYLKKQNYASIWKTLVMKINFADIMSEYYKEMGENKIGVYFELGKRKPTFLIKDPELAKNILVADASHFMSRASEDYVDNGPYVPRMLTGLEGEEFKKMKGIVAQNFSMAKIKINFEASNHFAQEFCTNLQQARKSEDFSVNFCQFANLYAMDVMAFSIFNIELNSFKIPNQLASMATKSQTASATALLLEYILGVLPKGFEKFYNIIAIRKSRNEESSDYLLKFIIQALDSRLEEMSGNCNNNSNSSSDGGKNLDLLQILINERVKRNDMIAQCLLFLVAGYDGIETLCKFTAHALAWHPRVQQKVFEEIETCAQENGQQLSFECIASLKYMDMVIDETMRRYPVNHRIERSCSSQAYTFPGTNAQIQKGQKVVIPIHLIAVDSENYSNPQEFIPERFLADFNEFYEREKKYFMGFGHGPRHCMAQKFGKMNTKILLANLILRFKLEPGAGSQDPPLLAKNTLSRATSRFKNECLIKLKERKTNN